MLMYLKKIAQVFVQIVVAVVADCDLDDVVAAAVGPHTLANWFQSVPVNCIR